MHFQLIPCMVSQALDSREFVWPQRIDSKAGLRKSILSWNSVMVDTCELIANARFWSEGLPSAMIARDQCKERRIKLRKKGPLRTKLSSELAWSFSKSFGQ